MSEPATSSQTAATYHDRWGGCLDVWFAVFVSFLLQSALVSPVPAVNEPHYLAKAKHYWDPQWCAGDLFLESADAHLVFYQTVGLLTRWLSLSATAWVGRAIALGLVASGWIALGRRLVAHRWAALWSAWLFLALARLGNLSGEWLIGGVEAKVFAYGLVLWALAHAIDAHPYRAAVCLGLGISFHVVVGIWAAACLLFATASTLFLRRVRLRPQRSTLITAVGAGLLLMACAAPGFLPAVRLVIGVPPKLAFQADFIQVAYRLQHHLDPMQFSVIACVGYVGLVVVWQVARWWAPGPSGELFFAAFVWAAILLALCGVAIGVGPRPMQEMPWYELRIWLLKFYPFRLADVFVPLAASIAVAGLGEKLGRPASKRDRTRRALIWSAFSACFCFSLACPWGKHHPSRLTAPQLADWREVCRWADRATPADALFLAPKTWGFKWYGKRPEYVSFKDCPQDASGVVEWNRRLRSISKWAERTYDNGFSDDALRQLRAETGVDYAILRKLGPVDQPPVYGNNTFRVYKLQ